jgi:hypothetical protein
MRDPVPFHLELAGESATLYVHGCLDQQSATTMAEVCRFLPQSVRTLRLDLRAVGVMTVEATSTVRVLVKQWRDGRRGQFRLSTSHLVAVCESVPAATPDEMLASGPYRHPMALAPL